jgi:benzodiazapine receptor
MSPSLPALVGLVGLCLLVGAVSGGITATSVHSWYLTLTAPPGTPPNAVFGPVWTVLYVMIGVAAWLIWRRDGSADSRRRSALLLWGWQLLLNALWTPAFFGLRSPALGLVVMAPLLVLAILTARTFRPISRAAGLLMLPYIAWVSYAAYLNAGFWWLNRGG